MTSTELVNSLVLGAEHGSTVDVTMSRGVEEQGVRTDIWAGNNAPCLAYTTVHLADGRRFAWTGGWSTECGSFAGYPSGVYVSGFSFPNPLPSPLSACCFISICLFGLPIVFHNRLRLSTLVHRCKRRTGVCIRKSKLMTASYTNELKELLTFTSLCVA